MAHNPHSIGGGIQGMEGVHVDMGPPYEQGGDRIADGLPTKMVGIAIASIWLIAAAAAPNDGYSGQTASFVVVITGLESYMIAVGSTGLIISLLTLFLIKCVPGPLEKKLCSCKGTPINLQQFIAMFMFVWWAAGAGIGTFQGPFIFTSNGYFALWTGFGCSLSALGDCSDDVRKQLTKGRARIAQTGQRGGTSISGPALGLLCAAVVLLFASINPVDSARRGIGGYTWEPVFGLVSAVLTIIVCILLRCVEDKHYLVKALVLLLALDWIPCAGILTFRGPFTTTSNGFFASYVALFYCFVLVSIKFFEK